MRAVRTLTVVMSIAWIACAGSDAQGSPDARAGAPRPTAPAPAPAPAPVTGSVTPAGPRAAGDDFATQVKALYDLGACGGATPIAPIDPRHAGKAHDRHCKAMKARYAAYRRRWADTARAFIAELRPAGLPSTVVYPFGGGDLSSALVVFPDAAEITTISLEAAGDVRAVDGIDARALRADLDVIGRDIGRLYKAAHSTTKSLQAASHSRLPGTIVFALAALAVNDLEPLSLRYFDFAADGSLVYLTGAELDRRAAAAVAAARAAAPPRRKGKRAKGTVDHFWHQQESVFANIEITFRARGDTGATPRVYRHVVANLDDSHLAADPRVLRHLEARGKVSVMTKAASFLLWYDDFSTIRGYLLGHLAWMISDASGIPPSHAALAGLEQITYGTFVDAYFIKDPNNTRRQFIDLWRRQPARPLPFRFGYPDAEDHAHLMVTRPKR